MSRDIYIARYDNGKITCPVCRNDSYITKSFHVAGSILQAFDIEGLGKTGVMLICTRCSHILYFADPEGISLIREPM